MTFIVQEIQEGFFKMIWNIRNQNFHDALKNNNTTLYKLIAANHHYQKKLRSLNKSALTPDCNYNFWNGTSTTLATNTGSTTQHNSFDHRNHIFIKAADRNELIITL